MPELGVVDGEGPDAAVDKAIRGRLYRRGGSCRLLGLDWVSGDISGVVGRLGGSNGWIDLVYTKPIQKKRRQAQRIGFYLYILNFPSPYLFRLLDGC